MKEHSTHDDKDINRRVVDDLTHANTTKETLQEDSHNEQIDNH